jgi:hypothetical protein
VLREDPSLAVVLPEDHTCEVVEAPAVEAVAEDYYEVEAPAAESTDGSDTSSVSEVGNIAGA